jgi:hypothetical protein
MRRLFFLVIFAPFVSFAHTELQVPMKKMGQDFKLLGQQAADSSKNEASLLLANDMLTLVNQAKDVMPETVANLPEPERSRAFVEFQDTMGVLQNQLRQLIDAFKNNENARAVGIISIMSETKKTGHEKFKN